MLPTPPASPKPLQDCNPESRVGSVVAGYIELTSVLGVGAYGTVYCARNIETNEQYAVKALNKTALDARQREFQSREMQLHCYAQQHSNVLSMKQIVNSPDCTYVVLEYCPEGDLFSKITDEGDYIGNDAKVKCVFLQILDAVQHCHALGIYHRDLKPENILVKDDGWTAKLADFGLATRDRVTADFGCGSTFYMSPECQQVNPKPFACYLSAPNDVWSLGVVLVNLVCGRNPWKRATLDDSTFRAYARDRNFLQTILPISDNLNAILQRIFEIDPKRRISLDALREMIARCPKLSQTTDAHLAPTPPYSPIGQPFEPVTAAPTKDFDSIPSIDLPVQQYPPQTSHTTVQSNNIHFKLPTSPGSTNGSPTHSPYTYLAKPTFPSVCPPFVNQTTLPVNGPTWSRCANLLPNLASQGCWRNVPVF